MAGGQNRLIGKLDNKDLLHTREARVRRNLVQGDNKHIKSYRSLEARVRRMWHATDTSDSQLVSCSVNSVSPLGSSGSQSFWPDRGTWIPQYWDTIPWYWEALAYVVAQWFLENMF